jgi:hypothetical protein
MFSQIKSKELTMAEKISMCQAVMSVLASFVGIQSSKTYDRDASDENFKQLITFGIVLAVILHVGIYLVVKIILWNYGAH